MAVFSITTINQQMTLGVVGLLALGLQELLEEKDA
jgi:hypothetical protein